MMYAPSSPPAPDGRILSAVVTVTRSGPFTGEYAIVSDGGRVYGTGGQSAAEDAAARHGLTLSAWAPMSGGVYRYTDDTRTTTRLEPDAVRAYGYELDWARCPR
jgi:hypothetical protein